MTAARSSQKLHRRINDTSSIFDIYKIYNNFNMLTIICAELVQYSG